VSADSAWWLRLPSAMAAVAAAGVLVLLASHFFGRRTALVAGLLFAAHPMVTCYAQDAPPYTLVTLGLLLSTALLLRALEYPSGPRLIGYVLASVLTLYPVAGSMMLRAICPPHRQRRIVLVEVAMPPRRNVTFCPGVFRVLRRRLSRPHRGRRLPRDHHRSRPGPGTRTAR
jgi:hypothetical protein